MAGAKRGRIPAATWRAEIGDDAELLLLGGEFVERERRAVAKSAAAAPTDPAGFDATRRA